MSLINYVIVLIKQKNNNVWFLIFAVSTLLPNKITEIALKSGLLEYICVFMLVRALPNLVNPISMQKRALSLI